MVVFCVLKKHCQTVATLFESLGRRAFIYHAGMPLGDRAAASAAFQTGGAGSALVATSAYEMGVNVPGIRWVVHYGLPASLESYVQGLGRAGRDVRPASAILLYGDADLDILDSLERLGSKSLNDLGASERFLNLAAQDVYAFAVTRTCRKAFLRSHFHPELRWRSRLRHVSPGTSTLRTWRKRVASAAGRPASTVFTDREIARIAVHQPATTVDLAKVDGVRRPNIARYGAEVTDLIRSVTIGANGEQALNGSTTKIKGISTTRVRYSTKIVY